MSYNQTDITNLNNAESETQLSRRAGYKVGSAKCVFDPSANTGERTATAHGLGLTIPKNSIVTRVVYKVLTTFTSANDSATIALSLVSANDITTATAISAGGNIWDAGGAVLGTPVTATANTWLTTTADSEVTATVAVQALTAGKLVVWVEWFYYGDV